MARLTSLALLYCVCRVAAYVTCREHPLFLSFAFCTKSNLNSNVKRSGFALYYLWLTVASVLHAKAKTRIEYLHTGWLVSVFGLSDIHALLLFAESSKVASECVMRSEDERGRGSTQLFWRQNASENQPP